MKSFKQYIQEQTDKKDSITFDIPLLIRVLELAREDVKTDMELHRVVERLINIRDKGTLTMDDYNFIANLKEEYIDETGRCWDGYKPKAGKKAYAKGSCVKEGHVEELENGLKELDSHDYDTINDLMMKISKNNDISGKKLHDDFKNKHGKIPDDWIKQNSKYVKEDGMGAGAAGGVADPNNVVGGGAIAGTGGEGNEPGVNLKKQNKNSPKSPVMGIINRKMPKI